MEFRYKALHVRQTTSNRTLAIFAAKATEIERWAGVPQKKRFGTGEETAGFQREYKQARIDSLREFYSNPDNIIQNPLLCATRNLPFAKLRFEPDVGQDWSADLCHGTVVIDIPDYHAMSLREIMGHVREYLECRVAELRARTPEEVLINTLKMKATESGHFQAESQDENQEEPEIATADAEDAADGDHGDPSSVLFEESHIIDFWQEVAARHELLGLIDGYRLSNQAKEQLIRLKTRTGIQQWNILCRWALCLSLKEKTPPTPIDIPADSNVEMTWQVFGGEHHELYLALLKQRCKNDGLDVTTDTLNRQLRLHLHRGIGYMAAHGFIRRIDDLVRLTKES